MTRFLDVRSILMADYERMKPALEYLARAEAQERRRNEIAGIHLEIAELERVMSGEFSDETKAYCRKAWRDMQRRIVDLEAA